MSKLTISRNEFVKFYSSAYQLPATVGHKVFTEWAIAILYAHRMGGDDATIKDQLSVHLNDVLYNPKKLKTIVRTQTDGGISFIRAVSPELFQSISPRLKHIDALIYEERQAFQKDRASATSVTSISLDVSLNMDKPTYERAAEIFDAKGQAISNSWLDTKLSIKGWASGVSDFFSNAGTNIALETGLIKRSNPTTIANLPDEQIVLENKKNATVQKDKVLSQDPSFKGIANEAVASDPSFSGIGAPQGRGVARIPLENQQSRSSRSQNADNGSRIPRTYNYDQSSENDSSFDEEEFPLLKFATEAQN